MKTYSETARYNLEMKKQAKFDTTLNVVCCVLFLIVCAFNIHFICQL